MNELTLTPAKPTAAITYDLITSKAYVCLDHAMATGMKSALDLNQLQITIQPSGPFNEGMEPIEVAIHVDPSQKQPQFAIKKKYKRFKKGENRLDWLTIKIDASDIKDFEKIKLRYTLEDAYEVEKSDGIPEDLLRVVYFDIRDGKYTLESRSPEMQEAIRKSMYMKLLENSK